MTGLGATGSVAAVSPLTVTGAEDIAAFPDMKHTIVYVSALNVTDSGALVAGPSVSISPTIPPLALSRLISPEAEEEFRTVRVCVPGRAAVKSRPQVVLVTVTLEDDALVAAGSATIVAPAASAGTATSAPATTQVRCPARRSQ